MLTCAIVWFVTNAGVTNMPIGMFVMTIGGDVAICFFAACAFAGWPGDGRRSRPKGG